ncbi:MAG: glycoside hydrolase family 71 protein [Propionicimonas sp.]|uniref:glycoside hydrolase family 71 protein n=1 Tax=Propionicimonas sp. TaxID=1955623 RepID=UPI0025EF66FC|nr:glycoside hydrolase family 71 protein [Propionicimonas sp.]MCG2804900.1 glycoside hydrolase family 71 protein [Propionicimonas sp.]
MPPTLGGTRIRRSLTAFASALAVLTLTFVGALPTATRSSAATLVTRNTNVGVAANAYTDSKHRKTSHRNVSTPKLDKSRYASYFAFPAVPLNPGEAISRAAVVVNIRKATKPSQGVLKVRAVTSGWNGGKLSYKNRPKLGPVLGTARIKAKGLLTITLDAKVAAPYLAKGARLQITRTGSKYLVKLASKPTYLKLSIGDAQAVASEQAKQPQQTAADAKITGKPVFAHYFPPYPISLDNQLGTKDYYAVNYLSPTGENSKFAWCGGLLRDRPLTRSPLSGDFWLADLRTEVAQAKKAGLSGFAVDILTFNTSDRNWVLVEKLLQAAQEAGDFKIMLQPDMSALSGVSTTQFATAIASLAKYGSAYRLGSGAVVVSPFLAENKTPSWYSDALAKLKSTHKVSVALLPLFLDASNMNSYKDVSIGFGNWGVRNVAAATTWPNWTSKAHALGKMWMEPVSVQDVRPNQSIYDEASNTGTLAATWNRAISQGADLVLLTTWNDYSESTSFAPSSDHGWAFLNLNRYFVKKFQTGSGQIGTEQVIISHRIQRATTAVSYSGTMKLRSGSTAARDKIEVVTMLAAASTVSVVIAGETHTYQAAAGLYTKLFDLQAGTFTATVTRSGATVATVTTKDAVSFATTAQQDLSYHAVTSDR